MALEAFQCAASQQSHRRCLLHRFDEERSSFTIIHRPISLWIFTVGEQIGGNPSKIADLICGTLCRMRLLIVLVLTFSLVFAAELPNSSPAQVGFAPDRLHRIDEVMREHIAAGHLSGASGLISRNGKIVFREAWGDYKLDTIVRMYSMTKAITGVAAMICYEEGKFSLTDPVSKYLPEFEHMRVGKEAKDAAGKRIYYTMPADRPILVRDLFRHTTGLDYAGPLDEKGEPAYKKLEMLGGAPLVSFNLAEAVKRLATAPLNDEPGTMWRYGYSIDVFGTAGGSGV